MKALMLLKKWGIPFHATFTQKGVLLNQLKQMAIENALPCDFPGLIPLDELMRVYSTCSVFVAPGPDEPWAMRVNDALQCGAPLLISTGTGAVQLVGRYGCGCSFTRNDYVELANKLRVLAVDDQYYNQCVRQASMAANEITPQKMARRLMNEIRSRVKGWD